MSYRNSREVLEARRATLEAELKTIHSHVSNLETMKRREAEVARDLWETEQQIGAAPEARRGLPMLEDVRIATPCRASWDDMVGDEQVRFCKGCQKNVYDLSAMTRDDAEALLHKNEKGEMCARLYRRADGTMITSDCSVGLQRKRSRQFAVAAVGGGLLAASVLSQVVELPGVPGRRMGEMRVSAREEMGDVAPPEGEPVTPDRPPVSEPSVQPPQLPQPPPVDGPAQPRPGLERAHPTMGVVRMTPRPPAPSNGKSGTTKR